MKAWSLLTVLFICLWCLKASADQASEGRVLLVTIDLAETAEKHINMYRRETARAIGRIQKIVGASYSRIIFQHRQEATRTNFMNTMRELAADERVKVIDTIVYLHGKNDSYQNGAAICFVDTKSCSSMESVAEELKTIPNLEAKLRALYSDACWGVFHLDHWLEAGFKVVSGARGVDSNKSADLKRFLLKWVKGESFGDSIAFANRLWVTPVVDFVLKNGNSIKDVVGDETISIR